MRWQTRRKQSPTDKSVYFLCTADGKQRKLRGGELEGEKRQKDSNRDCSVNTELLGWTKPVGMAGNTKQEVIGGTSLFNLFS